MPYVNMNMEWYRQVTTEELAEKKSPSATSSTTNPIRPMRSKFGVRFETSAANHLSVSMACKRVKQCCQRTQKIVVHLFMHTHKDARDLYVWSVGITVMQFSAERGSRCCTIHSRPICPREMPAPSVPLYSCYRYRRHIEYRLHAIYACLRMQRQSV